MQKISINQAKEGMVLAAPVLNEEEKILVSTGAALTFNEISWLKSLGINQIFIKRDESSEGPADVIDNPAIRQLFRDYQVRDIDGLKDKMREQLNKYFRPLNSSLRTEMFNKCLHYVFVKNKIA